MKSIVDDVRLLRVGITMIFRMQRAKLQPPLEGYSFPLFSAKEMLHVLDADIGQGPSALVMHVDSQRQRIRITGNRGRQPPFHGRIPDWVRTALGLGCAGGFIRADLHHTSQRICPRPLPYGMRRLPRT